MQLTDSFLVPRFKQNILVCSKLGASKVMASRCSYRKQYCAKKKTEKAWITDAERRWQDLTRSYNERGISQIAKFNNAKIFKFV